MRLGQIRRLHTWLNCTGYMLNDDPALKQSRTQVSPIIKSLVQSNEGFEDGLEIKTPFIENETLEQIEIRCYGHTVTSLVLGGYAPGNYMGTCRTCETTFIGDKRCRTCIPCAATAPINLS